MDLERIGRLGSKAKGDRSHLSKGLAAARAGRIGIGLVLGLAVASILGIWLVSRDSPGTRTREARPLQGPEPGPAPSRLDPPGRPDPSPERHATSEGPGEASARGDGSGTTLRPGRPGPDASSAFQGSGMLRGHIQAQGVDFPEAWTLIVRPSRTLIGREYATTRRVEFEHGEQDFRVEGLPFAGYDLEPQAPGLNGRVLPILLRKGNEAPFVNLILVPAGFIEGVVTDALGMPQEDVPITLIAMPEGTQTTTRTDYSGVYRFDKVLDGPYELLVGLVESPLVKERKSIAFRAPSLSVPNIELPPLAGLELRVADDLNRSIPDVEVRASGSRGGSFTKKTDVEGRVSLRHIPEGRLRLSFHHPDYKSSRAHIDLKKGQVLQKTWVLFD